MHFHILDPEHSDLCLSLHQKDSHRQSSYMIPKYPSCMHALKHWETFTINTTWNELKLRRSWQGAHRTSPPRRATLRQQLHKKKEPRRHLHRARAWSQHNTPGQHRPRPGAPKTSTRDVHMRSDARSRAFACTRSLNATCVVINGFRTHFYCNSV